MCGVPRPKWNPKLKLDGVERLGDLVLISISPNFL